MKHSYFYTLLNLSLLSGWKILAVPQKQTSLVKDIFFTPSKKRLIPAVNLKIIRLANDQHALSFHHRLEQKASAFAQTMVQSIHRRLSARQKDVLLCIAKETFVSAVYHKMVSKVLCKKKKEARDLQFLYSLRQKYQAKDNAHLIAILEPIPLTLSLAQCCAESSWGKAGKKNALFGMNGRKRKTATFSSIKESFYAYKKLLNTSRYFRSFRNIRTKVTLKKADYSQLLSTLKVYCPVGNYPRALMNIISKMRLKCADKLLADHVRLWFSNRIDRLGPNRI